MVNIFRALTGEADFRMVRLNAVNTSLNAAFFGFGAAFGRLGTAVFVPHFIMQLHFVESHYAVFCAVGCATVHVLHK